MHFFRNLPAIIVFVEFRPVRAYRGVDGVGGDSESSAD